MRRPSTVLIAGLIACAADDSPGDDDGAADDLPSPYADDDGGDEDAAMPSLGPEQVGATAVAGLREFAQLRPQVVIDAYVAIAVHDDACPEEFEEIVEGGTTVQIWYTDGCTTAAGVGFAGGGRFESYSYEEEAGYAVTGAVLNAEGASFSVASAEGRSLMLSGYFGYTRGTAEDYTDSSIEILGHATADPTTAAGARLLDGTISAQGYMYSYADAEVKAMGGEGAWSGTGLGDARAFAFAGTQLISAGCTAEPAGSISMRDGEGFWHDIVFDGIAMDGEETVFPAGLCDGCGAYLAAGEPGGEACVAGAELAAMLDWEQFAW